MASVAVISIEARAAFHLNRDYPIRFRAGPGPEGLVWPRPSIEREQFRLEPCAEGGENCRARAELPFLAEREGLLRLSGELAASVCDAEHCLIEKVLLEASVEVRRSSSP